MHIEIDAWGTGFLEAETFLALKLSPVTTFGIVSRIQEVA